MSTPVISGDGIFSHIFIGAADLQKSVAFYDAALGALGIKNWSYQLSLDSARI